MKIGQHIHFVAIDSTNTYAKMNCSSLDLPALITADCQTNGRGRQGKTFFSPADTGIYFSLLFNADDDFDLITPAAANCVCEAIEEFTGKSPGIKWVNDIFIDGKKVCGILTERFFSSGKVFTCVGFGVNITTEDFPPELINAGSLGVDFDRTGFARYTCELLLEINENYDRRAVVSDYKSRQFIIGKNIMFTENNIEMSGKAIDIDDNCNLIIETPEGIRTLSSGEVSITLR